MRLLAAAIAFLTRLPVARGSAFDAKTVARAARWFPLAGALLGAIYTVALRLAAPVFPAAVTAVMLTALDAALTGALHLDGLADCADGFGGGRTREDVLRIMRDHAIGAYGAVALVLALAFRIAAVAALIARGGALPPVFLAPVLGRWAAVLLGATQPYARPPDQDATGAPARYMSGTELVIATATAALAAAVCGWRGTLAGLLAGAAALLWGWRSARRIGGITGDTLGAAVVVVECLVLTVFSAAA